MLRTWRQRVTFIDLVVWAIGVAIAVVVVVGSIKTLQSGKYAPTVWLDLTIKGLALGGVYALIAMGYTLVYGILKMINFAHSEVFMSGPFTAVFLAILSRQVRLHGSHPVVGLLLITLVAVVVSATVAMLVERIAYRPLRGRSPPGSPDHGHWRVILPAVRFSRSVRIRLQGLPHGEGVAGIRHVLWHCRSSIPSWS